ncbi:hypothetical protein GQ602_004326 [Ophiocordyceps camponoti-floridani]|uniref:A-kinase anchor protein 7-like phosphoesterase domain-containing protein n=1 Tax=Ophiocordyceps camponoti-floridani TaxID=2030778 RepID=A0A8H4VDN4_9HYPO|nr:hypothetical protein GQ602_004326 [Ophiocordyceps camponoti-floridani]
MAIRSPRSMHLTLGVLSLPGEAEISQAKKTLEELRPKEILARLGNPNPSPNPLTASIRGLHAPRRSTKTHALYAHAFYEGVWLFEFCKSLRKHFIDSKVMKPPKGTLKLNTTVWNNMHVHRQRQMVDARRLMKECDDFVWADEVPITKLQICKMGMKGGEGKREFLVEAERSLDSRDAEPVHPLKKKKRKKKKKTTTTTTTTTTTMDATSRRRIVPRTGSSQSNSKVCSPSHSDSDTPNEAHDTPNLTASTPPETTKDERIAHLESEISRLQRSHRRDESQTTLFWQAKHSALHRQFLDADTQLRLVRSSRDDLLDGWEALRRELARREADVERLVGQNWVIIYFRRARLDVSVADSASVEELARLVPGYERLLPSAKIHVLQSVVASVLVETVFDAYFFGLTEEQTGDFRRMERLLRSFSAPDEAINQWRSSTLALLDPPLPITTDQIDSIVQRIQTLLDGLVPARTSAAGRESALRILVGKAVDLARLLAVQRAVMRVGGEEGVCGGRL